MAEPDHGFSASIAVCETDFRAFELFSIPRRALIFSKVLLCQALFNTHRHSSDLRNMPCRLSSARQRRAEDLVNVYPFFQDFFCKLFCLPVPFFRQLDVYYTTDFIFHIPYGLPMTSEINISHRIPSIRAIPALVSLTALFPGCFLSQFILQPFLLVKTQFFDNISYP